MLIKIAGYTIHFIRLNVRMPVVGIVLENFTNINQSFAN